MKNKKIVAAVIAAIACVLIGMVAGQLDSGSNGGNESAESGSSSADEVIEQAGTAAGSESVTATESAPGEDSKTEKAEDQSGASGTADSKTTEDVSDRTEDAVEDGTSGDGSQNYGSGAVIDDGHESSSGHSVSSQSVSWQNLDNYYDDSSSSPEISPTPKIVDDLAFPYTIPDRNLIVRKIASYDGIFLEDGSDSEVEGIAVIVLENTGAQAVEYAEIMFSGTGGQFTFECSDLPAGGVTVVQEKNAAAYRESVHWRKCECATSMLDELEMSEDAVKVSETEDGSLLVENVSSEDIPCVRVFYKFYDEENNAYIGGITYMVKITDLAAGGQTTVTPSHYASGYSRIVMVRTYDTAEG